MAPCFKEKQKIKNVGSTALFISAIDRLELDQNVPVF